MVVVRSGPTSYVIQMQGGKVLWKKHIDHIKPLIFASSSLPPVILSQAAQHSEPSPYLSCSPDLPPVKLTNSGHDPTEGAAALLRLRSLKVLFPPHGKPQLLTQQRVLLYQWWYLIIPTHLAEWKEILQLHHHHQWILLL